MNKTDNDKTMEISYLEAASENKRLKEQLRKSNNWKYVVGIVSLVLLAILMIVTNGIAATDLGPICIFKLPLSTIIGYLISSYKSIYTFTGIIACLSETFVAIWAIVNIVKLSRALIRNNKSII